MEGLVVPTPRLRALILDFDETMADTIAARSEAFQKAALHVLGKEITVAQARGALLSSSNVEGQMTLLADGRTSAISALVDTYREHVYRPERAPLALYPGMAEALAALTTAGIRLGLVTSRYRIGPNGNAAWGVHGELQRMGRGDVFEVIVGFEDSTEHKPSPAPFLACLGQLGLSANECMAVGDAATDILGAKAAGIAAAAALWGCQDRAGLLASKPDTLLQTPLDLKYVLTGQRPFTSEGSS